MCVADHVDTVAEIYLARYSREVIHAKGSTEPQGSFEKFLEGGRIVAEV